MQEGCRSSWSSCRTTATRPSAACPSRSAPNASAPPTGYRAEDGGVHRHPLPVDLAANAASLGMRRAARRTVGELREALAEARGADRPTCVYVETETADTVSGAPSGTGVVGCSGGRDRDPPVGGRGPRGVRPAAIASPTPPPVTGDPSVMKTVNHWIGGKTSATGRVGQLRAGHRPGDRRGHHPGGASPPSRRSTRRWPPPRPRTRPGARPRSPPRTAVLFRYRALLDAHRDDIAALITAEHGKVHSDALGEVARGLEIVELACGITTQLKGELSTQVVQPGRRRLDPAAARRGRGHHPVQLPGHGADVDVPAGHRVRQHLRPQAQREGPVGRQPAGGAGRPRRACPTAC